MGINKDQVQERTEEAQGNVKGIIGNPLGN